MDYFYKGIPEDILTDDCNKKIQKNIMMDNIDLLKRILLQFLINGQLDFNITGLDMMDFSNAMQRELQSRLESIWFIVRNETDYISDSDKIADIELLFCEDFYIE